MAREWELYNTYPAINGRPLNFVYFGGGTPSFLSVRQLDRLVSRLKAASVWTSAEEITFECEPGTLTESKLAAIRDMGVTRLSLGIENFDDGILELNGRAHRSPEIFRAYQFARSLKFPQINVDLIAGMLGETEENWQRCVEKTIELEGRQRHDLPDGAAVQHDDQQRRAERHWVQEHVASWSTKRRWDEAFDALQRARLHVGSARRSKIPTDQVYLSRPPVAGRRSGRAGRGVVRTPQRRARTEPRHLGDIQRGHQCRRPSAESGAPA